MPVPEGFIMPTLGTQVSGHVLKAVPSADAISGVMGTMVAEVRRHRELNAKRTQELIESNLPGDMRDDIEIILIKTDKFSTVPLRASNLSDPTAPFNCELSREQQIALAELRERFRKNEHGCDMPIANWDCLNVSEQMHLINMGVLYVEQLAAYQDNEIYKLGNGGAELVKRAKRFVEAKQPNKQEDFERQMQEILNARSAEKARADEAERRYFEQQQEIAELKKMVAAGSAVGDAVEKRRPGRPPKAGVQQEA